jgi:hypothetical protein
MKLYTRQLLSLLFLFIITAETCFAFNNRKYRSARKFKSQNKKSSVNLDAPKITLNVPNSGFSFMVGAIEAIGGDITGWYECLPKEWTKEVNNDVIKTSGVDAQLANLNESFQNVLKVIGVVVQATCAVRDAVLIVVKQILGNDGKKSFFLLEGKFVRRRFKSKRGVLDWIQNTTSDTWVVVKDSVTSAWNSLSQPVKDAIDKIKEELLKLKKKLQEFFKGPAWDNMVKVGLCVSTGMKFAKEVSTLFKSGYDKIVNINMGLALGGVAVILVLADIIIGLICNWEEFKKAIDSFFTGAGKSDKNEKAYFYGRGAGGLFRAIAGAKTLSEDITADIMKKLKNK